MQLLSARALYGNFETLPNVRYGSKAAMSAMGGKRTWGRAKRAINLCRLQVVTRGKRWHQTAVQDDQIDPGQAFQKLMASIGSLIFCWCRLEDSVADALRTARGNRSAKVSNSFNDQLSEWSALLENRWQEEKSPSAALRALVARIDGVRFQRNLIVHRFAGASSDPSKGAPHIICGERERTGRKPEKITQSELSALLQEIDSCRREVTSLSDGSLPLQR